MPWAIPIQSPEGRRILQPGATAVTPTYVGQVVGLDGWSEPNPPSLFLTAVAPGNNMFAAYQPYCQNVFSMFDPLDGSPESPLAYFVAGWYSNQADDIVGSWQDGGDFESFLARAGWERAGESTDVATWALYHGMVWHVETATSTVNIPTNQPTVVSIGNTTVEALTAMIKPGVSSYDFSSLLEAFQSGLLGDLDHPDPAIDLSQDLQLSAFTSRRGGYAWEIVDAPVDPSQGNPPPPISAAERKKEDQWLATLNRQQRDYDQAVVSLADQQWNLYQMWWKYGNAQKQSAFPAGTSEALFQAALDAQSSTSLVSQVYQAQQKVAQLAATIPTGATQDDLQSAIQAYAAAQSLPASRQLKQIVLRPFQEANNPVLLVSGASVDTVRTTPLQCRFQDQLVTGFTYTTDTITLSDLLSILPSPGNLSAVPAPIANLIGEFFLLDPDNATMIAASVLHASSQITITGVAQAMSDPSSDIGICPDIDLSQWTQPWRPLILNWDITFYPIDHDSNGTPLWSFDGKDYQWTGEGFDSTAPTWDYRGMMFTAPQAGINLKAQLQKILDEDPNIECAKDLKKFIADIDLFWDFQSASLVGLNQMMTMLDPRPNVSPSLEQKTYDGQTLADLVGNAADYVPYPGPPQPAPGAPSGFQSWRAGQFVINRLWLVDRFGQNYQIVKSAQKADTFFVAPSFEPPSYLVPQLNAQFVQLVPRLLQPARLDFDFVSASDSSKILGVETAVNPICAWLLHNLLDESIVAYSPAGDALGAVWIVTDEQNQEIVNWTPAPGSSYATVADLVNSTDLAELGQMLTALQSAGPDAFRSLSLTLDEASWTIAGGQTTSDAGLALLAGQPVAIARVRLQFVLEGDVVTDPSWPYTFAPTTNPMTGWQFNIRLGEPGQTSDGLIGYYGADYNTFYAAAVPENVPDTSYVTPIGTGSALALPFDGETSAVLTLLMDPRSVVHATTGILPVVDVAIPQTFIDAALGRMQVTFRIGPLLAESVHQQTASSVAMPRPSLKKGTWTWQQYDGSAWSTFSISQAAADARFSNVPPVLREGLLKLSGAEAPTGTPETVSRTRQASKIQMIAPRKGSRS